MLEYLLRFVVGGLIVSAFAAVGGIVKPKSFAGLFGAAPSVALATLGLTLFAYVARLLLAKGRFGAATVSITGLGIWLVVAVGAWLLVPK